MLRDPTANRLKRLRQMRRMLANGTVRGSHPGVTVLFAVDHSRRTIGSNGHRPSDVHNGLAG